MIRIISAALGLALVLALPRASNANATLPALDSEVVAAPLSTGAPDTRPQETRDATAPISTLEPQTMFLLGAALIGLGALARRRLFG
jgi:hypothetical protein